jgi:hypothetical protein
LLLEVAVAEQLLVAVAVAVVFDQVQIFPFLQVLLIQ